MAHQSIRLRPRLRMTARLITPGSTVADIGTDHAYLPVYLIQQGVCPSAYACDVRSGPLENARQTVQGYGLEGKIQILHSDGLDALSPKLIDTAILAGMGGTLIVRLLSRAPWLKEPGKRIVLQPMSRAEEIRTFFAANGFAIEREDVTLDEGRCYLALSARYTGNAAPRRPAYAYLGRLAECGKPEAAQYLFRQTCHLQTRLAALRQAGRKIEEQQALEPVLADLKQEVEALFHDDGSGSL